MKSSEITIKKLNILKEPSCDLLKFISNIFPDINKNKWEWEYKNTPKSRGIVWIALVNNKIAVHYAFIILSFKYKNKVFKVAKAEGSLADINILKRLPKQKRRLFKQVVSRALKDLEEENVDLVYGFPNKKAIKSQISGGFDLAKFSFNYSKAIFNIKPILERKFLNKKFCIETFNLIYNLTYKPYLKIRANNLYNIKEISKINKKNIEEFFLKLNKINTKKMVIEKDLSFYRWRYLNNPYRKNVIYALSNNSSLEGIIVCAIDKVDNNKCIHIMELNYLNNNSLKKLLRWSLNWAISQKAYSIDIWTDIEDKNLASIMRLNGFIVRKNNKNMIIKIINNSLKINNIKLSASKYLERV